MKRIKYVPTADGLFVDGGYEMQWRDWFRGYVGPIDQLAEVSLVSFRHAAASYVKQTRHRQLALGWADYSTEQFEAGMPPPELVRLRSDGETVSAVVHLSLYDETSYPESADDVSSVLRHTIEPVADPFDAGITDIVVEPFRPTRARGVVVTLRIPPQRRVLDDAYRLGQSVRDRVHGYGDRVLGTPSGVINALGFAPAALIGQPESSWLTSIRRFHPAG